MSHLPTAELGVPEDLTVEAIERVLADLWHDIDEAHGESATSVRMLNLLVFLPSPPPPRIALAMNAVAIQHPGRTISVVPDEGSPRAEATIACQVSEGRQQACGEQIMLRGTVNGQPLYSLAIALLQPGLPVTVWWHGSIDFDSPVFRQLAKVADQIVFDTRMSRDLLATLLHLGREATMHTRHPRFTDLLWVELTAWRRLIAGAFDLPATRDMLPVLTRVELVYGQSEASLVAALLLAGWLATRLGWEPLEMRAHGGGIIVRLRRRAALGDQPEQVELTLRQNGSEEGIAIVEMRTEQGSACFLRRTGREDVEVRIEPAGQLPFVQASHLQQRSLVRLLGEELAFTTPDRVYNPALVLAARLAEEMYARR